MTDRRFDASKACRLDDPARLLWLPPAEVIGALVIQSGDFIADIGAGSGYFTLPLAKATGPRGQVYAVDSQARMLELLRQKLDAKQPSNIQEIQAEADSTGLPDASCHLVFMANVWHEFADRAAVLRECKRILKTDGRIAILDWRPDVEPEAGPPLDHRLSATQAENDLQCTGFRLDARTNIGKFSWLIQGIL
jgi:ubiquinone/menaquinone biosynthesis C-methylase UbiE